MMRATQAEGGEGAARQTQLASGPASGPRSLSRVSLLVFLAALLFFLPFGRGHFTGTDEVAQFEMTRSIAERGRLDIGPLMHTEEGRYGLRYSFFAVGQAALALPFYLAADAARSVLPHAWQRAIAGPRLADPRHVYGGDLERTFVCLYAPVATALLVALFFRFELLLGVSSRTAVIVAALLASSTYTLVMSTYFLRHSTVAVLLLGALYSFFQWRERGRPRDLVVGAALASAIPLVRVPASIVALGLAVQLGYSTFRRSQRFRDLRALATAGAATLMPLALAVGIHIAVNYAKWGAFFESPMVGQRAEFSNPLWVGVRGYLLSPGASIFVYSPLLLLAPLGLRELWRRWPAECVSFCMIFLACLLFHSKFDRWTGLWSAPGPRYLFLAVPLGLLPLGLWIDARSQRGKWMLVAPLALLGAFVQFMLTAVEWARVPRLAGYPLEPDRSDFLLDVDQSPILVMARLFFEGAPLDPWLWRLWHGWEFFPAQPLSALLLAAAWMLGLVALSLALRRELRALPGDAAASGP